MSNIKAFPLHSEMTASELLAGAAHHGFADVLIVGWLDDGALAYISSMSKGGDLHAMEYYRLITLDVIDGAERN